MELKLLVCLFMVNAFSATAFALEALGDKTGLVVSSILELPVVKPAAIMLPR